MKRAVQTALLSVSGHSGSLDANGQQKKITIIFSPVLRDQVTYQDTVASSIPEIKSFVSEILTEFNINANLFEFDYSLLGTDQLWYLQQISNV